MVTLTLAELSSRYGLELRSATPFSRSDEANDNQLLRLTAQSGESYFYKEIPSHSLREELVRVYAELSRMRPEAFRPILPLPARGGELVVEIEGRKGMLYPFVEHQVISAGGLPVAEAMELVRNVQRALAPLSFPEHAFKHYPGWLERGLTQLQKKFEAHPFLEAYGDFLRDRLPRLKLLKGNGHFDLNPFNVWRDAKGALCVSDFDNAQPAALVKDLFDLTAGHPEADFPAVLPLARELVPNGTDHDFRYLWLRPRMAPVFDPRGAMPREDGLRQMDEFLEFLRAR